MVGRLRQKTSNFNTQVDGDTFLFSNLYKGNGVCLKMESAETGGPILEFSLYDEFKLPVEHTVGYGQVAGHVSCTYAKVLN